MYKKLLTWIVGVLWTSLQAFGQVLPPQTEAPLFDHMVEVNKHWELFYETKPEWLLEKTSFANENDRISKHLDLVIENLLKTEDLPLTGSQISKRKILLASLKCYSGNKVFPENKYHLMRQPYFIDAYGTACAVGHMIIKSGRSDLAIHIAKEDNYAYVEDMYFPELLEWASNHGFQAEELAWVQPGYPPVALPFATFGSGEGPDGTIKTVYAVQGSNDLLVGGSFTTMDNVPTPNIARWDGNGWSAMGSLPGEVNDIELVEGTFYVAGEFDFGPGQSQVKIAYFENDIWNPIVTSGNNQTGLKLEVFDGMIYVGCYAGPPMGSLESGLIIIDPVGKQQVPGPTVIGHVLDLKASPEGLAIVGWFNYLQTGTVVQETKNFAVWTGNTFIHLSSNDVGLLSAIHYRHGKFLTANSEQFLWYDGLSWSQNGGTLFEGTDARVYKFLDVGPQILACGDFTFYPFVGNFAKGLVEIDYIEDQEYFSPNGFAYMDSTVFDMAIYGPKLVLGGSFSKAYNPWNEDSITLNRIATIDINFSTGISDPDRNVVSVYTYDQDLVVSFDDKPQAYTLMLYDALGRQVFFDEEPSDISRMQYQLPGLAPGSYFFRLETGSQVHSGAINLGL